MKFQEFAEFLNKVEQVSGRNEITENLAAFLKTTTPEEAKHLMYFLLGRLAPKFVPLEFNFSDKMILKALSQTYLDDPKKLLGELGDIGLVVFKLKDGKGTKNEELQLENPKTDKLESIMDVYDVLVKLANVGGKGSQDEKIKFYKYIIDNVNASSAKYISRIIVGDLRIGFSEKTILDAFSWYVTGDKSLRKDIDIAFGARADVGELAKIILGTSKDKVVQVLDNIKIMPLTPVASKLVERESSPATVWERMPNCFVQPKLDGLRGQIHYTSTPSSLLAEVEGELPKNAAIYSRNMESLTDQFPEIIEGVKSLGVDSIILDSEIIGFDSVSDSYRTYQDTMKRRRKNDIESFSKDIPVRAMCFDVLYLNGEDLTRKPVEERVKILEKLLKDNKSALTMLETKQMQSLEELDEYFEDKVGMGLEGIIAKQPGTNYDPGTRNFKWIKLKANTKSELVDTIDVVVLGYFYGQGVRSKNGFGALLAGVYNPEDDKFYSIGKVGSGFKDDEAPKMFQDLTNLKIDSNDLPENYVVHKTLFPDVWVKPKIVMEIVADEITRSPNHTAARGMKANVKGDDSEKGLSIRFPRLKIWKRDKDLPNSVGEILRMYELRKGK